jgi:predicted nucleic acid-binding protein
MTYALDTNAIIDVLNKEAGIVKRFNDAVKDNAPMVIPSAVDYEISRGFYHTPNPRKEAVYNNMRQNCPIIDVSADTWDRAAKIWAKLRKSGFTVGDADILIAAVCLVNGYTLVTANTKDFENISGLQMVNWVE